MNLTQLLYFHEVARLSHFTKAAENLNVSQPALSRAIKGLENELAVPLFIKKGRNVTLSEYGNALYEHTNFITEEIKNIKLKLNDLKESTNNSVSILINSASNQMLKLLVDFKKLYPSINIKITQLDRKEYNEKKNEFDLIIKSERESASLNNQVNLLEELLMAVVPLSNKLSKKSCIELKDLANEKFVFLSKNKDLREIIEYYLQKVGINPKVEFENNSPAIIKDYIKTGLACSIVPQITWKDLLTNNKMKVLKVCNPTCKRYVILEWKKKGYITKTSTILKDYIIKNFKKYI